MPRQVLAYIKYYVPKFIGKMIKSEVIQDLKIWELLFSFKTNWANLDYGWKFFSKFTMETKIIG